MPSIRLLTMLAAASLALAACGRVPGNTDARVSADFDQADYTPDATSQHPLDLVPVLSDNVGTP